MFIVLKKAQVLRLPFDIVCELFDKCVVPVLLYGSEVWGWSNLRDVEIFHRSFITLGNLIPGFQHNKLVSAEICCHQQKYPGCSTATTHGFSIFAWPLVICIS